MGTETPSNNRRIAKNTAFLYVRMMVVMVVTLFTSRVVLNTLGASDYGIYNIVGGIVTMMAFLNGALGSSSSRFLTYELGSGNMTQLKKTFAASLTLHIGVALLVFIVGETLGLWFLYEKLIIPNDRMTAAFWVYQFSILTTMISFTQVPYNASIIAHENMSIYAYVGLYEALSKLLISYLIQISPIDRLVFYGLLLMLNQAGVQIFYRIYTANRYEECHINIVKDRQLYKKLLGYSGWDLFGGIAIICQGQGINILLNIFFGPVVNAARAIAVQVQAAISMFVGNFLTAVRPQVVKSFAEGNTDRMYNLTFYGAKFSYLMMLCIVLPLVFEIDFILKLWLGDEVPADTPVFAILVLITYLMETYHTASLMPYHAIGRIKTGNIFGGTMMILSLPLAYLFLKKGMEAYMVFVAVFVVNFIQMFFGWWLLHSYVKFSYRKLTMEVYVPTILVTIISLIVPILLSYEMDDSWMRFLLLVTLTEIVCLSSSLFIGLNRKDRNKLFAIVKNKIKK